jgi:probable phosphoglycerate mutase
MEIIFIRHSEKELVGEDPPLTKRGVQQAKFLSKRLKREKIREFYCSNLNRAKQTAMIVSEKIRIKPQVEIALNEFASDFLIKSKNKWNKEEKEHYIKLISFLKKLTDDKNENKVVLIIAHGVTNRIILSYLLDLNFKNLIRFRQSETGLNSVYWADKFKNWRLKIWNDNSHIPIKLRYNESTY